MICHAATASASRPSVNYGHGSAPPKSSGTFPSTPKRHSCIAAECTRSVHRDGGYRPACGIVGRVLSPPPPVMMGMVSFIMQSEVAGC
jgi:hypothetical protein